MAVTVLQQPTTPNATGTNLVYTVSSSIATYPQFRYVTDIYESGSSELLTRIKTYPNLHGTCNIDVSRELNDRITWDNFWEAYTYNTPVNSVKTFDLRFGEEYGTSISSSRTIYTGSTPNYLTVFPGHVYANQGSYNFDTGSLFADRNILSNIPEAQYSNAYNTVGPDSQIILGVDDYYTITILKGDPFVNFSVYNADGSSVGGGTIATTGVDFTTIGIGPKNLSNNFAWANFFTGSAAYVQVENLLGGPNYSYTLAGSSLDNTCSDDKTRFAFINQYGFWDYYYVFKPLRRQSQVDRSTYERTFVRYEDRIGSYDITNRGTTQYYTQYNDVFEITTDYLSKATADWLTELFESPDVYIQSGTDFIPVNILDTTVTWNLDQNRNKLFQYTISFKYANQREPR